MVWHEHINVVYPHCTTRLLTIYCYTPVFILHVTYYRKMFVTEYVSNFGTNKNEHNLKLFKTMRKMFRSSEIII